ncbi:MAG TPA: bifunctional hydroxymethylpyrimidine kinase/phosphomethylpyrimidine kinase [Anaeromyxobacter sp.]|nr:bifunctional hydroxymethylpyrimidine kinase/phosphomethylpyrimidine kinase [Anaeromyxobacter sp.]
MKVALTIAGSDSGGGAGIQADLRTFAAHRIHGTSAITAVTAQNSVVVTAWAALAPELVVAQIEAVASDMPIAAAKTGMLANAAIIEAVADAAHRLTLGPLVVDPVMVAKSGDHLLDPAAERAYAALLPRAALLTPNLHEAAALLGRPVRHREEMRAAAQDLLAMGAGAVLVKGGALAEGDSVDVFCDRRGVVEVPGPRIDTLNVHGAGCTLSAAICARLALGEELLDAIRGAKAWLTEGLRSSYAVGRGRGPVNHLHEM